VVNRVAFYVPLLEETQFTQAQTYYLEPDPTGISHSPFDPTEALELPTALGNQTMGQPLRLEQVRTRLSDYLVTQRGGHGEIGGSASVKDGLVGPVKDVRLYGINKYRFCILLICSPSTTQPRRRPDINHTKSKVNT
jgi:hypothetical protein